MILRKRIKYDGNQKRIRIDRRRCTSNLIKHKADVLGIFLLKLIYSAHLFEHNGREVTLDFCTVQKYPYYFSIAVRFS